MEANASTPSPVVQAQSPAPTSAKLVSSVTVPATGLTAAADKPAGAVVPGGFRLLAGPVVNPPVNCPHCGKSTL